MGDRIQKIAAIIFALAFIAILSVINSNVIHIGTNANNQLSRTYNQTEAHELSAFDDTTVSGSTVISAIANYENICSIDLSIVYTTDGHNYSYTGYEVSGGVIVTNPRSISTTDYIDVGDAEDDFIASRSYHAEIGRNINGIVTCIIISPSE